MWQHISPVLLFVVPFYLIFPSPYTLLVIQALGPALAVILVYLIVMTLLNNKIAAILISFSFTLSRIVNYSVIYDFHMEVWYPFFFLSALYFLLKKRWIRFYILIFLAATIKEDAFIIIAGIGLYLFTRKEYKHGVVLLSFAVICIIISFALIIPYFKPTDGSPYPYTSFWTDYGKSQTEILLNVLNPVKNFRIIFTPFKIGNMFNLFSVYLFLPFLSGYAFLFLVLPSWFILFSSNNELMNSLLIYYGMAITPFLFYCTILTIKKYSEKYSNFKNKIIYTSAALLFIINLANSRLFKQLSPEYWNVNVRYRSAEELIQLIPDNAAVSSQVDLTPHIKPRDARYMIPGGIDRSKYVLFDTVENTFPVSKTDNEQLLKKLKGSGEWEEIDNKEGFVLLKRK